MLLTTRDENRTADAGERRDWVTGARVDARGGCCARAAAVRELDAAKVEHEARQDYYGEPGGWEECVSGCSGRVKAQRIRTLEQSRVIYWRVGSPVGP